MSEQQEGPQLEVHLKLGASTQTPQKTHLAELTKGDGEPQSLSVFKVMRPGKAREYKAVTAREAGQTCASS